jgi:hypothetical protein
MAFLDREKSMVLCSENLFGAMFVGDFTGFGFFITFFGALHNAKKWRNYDERMCLEWCL